MKRRVCQSALPGVVVVSAHLSATPILSASFAVFCSAWLQQSNAVTFKMKKTQREYGPTAQEDNNTRTDRRTKTETKQTAQITQISHCWTHTHIRAYLQQTGYPLLESV